MGINGVWLFEELEIDVIFCNMLLRIVYVDIYLYGLLFIRELVYNSFLEVEFL